MSRLMDIDELTAYLELSRETIEGLLKCWDFPVINIGGQSRFEKEEVDNWMIKKGRKAGGQRMSKLDVLKGDFDPITKRIIFTAILTEELEKEGFSPVVGGNYAAELYTSGGYKSEHIEVFSPIEALDKILLTLGFNKENGYLSNQEVDIIVRVLAEDLNNHELERVNQIDVDGFPVYLLGLEDTIIAKLKDYVHNDESGAVNLVQDLIEINVNEVDLDYLKERASKEGVFDVLKRLLIELRLEDEDEYEQKA